MTITAFFNSRLVVQAADKGNPRLSATSIVRVQVLDVNDNPPVVQPLGEVEVREGKCDSTAKLC